MIKLFEKFIKILEAKDEDIEDLKNIIFLKATNTGEIKIIESFIKKGYDYNNEDVLYAVCYNNEIFRYFLKKGIDVEIMRGYNFKRKLEDVDVQKALIDFGHEFIIFDTVGFNYTLKNDPNYADVIERCELAKKYNL